MATDVGNYVTGWMSVSCECRYTYQFRDHKSECDIQMLKIIIFIDHELSVI